MSKQVAHGRWWQIFEVVFGAPLLVAIALQWMLPIAFRRGLPILIACGAALMLAGAALVVLARRELARHGQPTDPGHPTRQLVTSGVFSISRNPLYLGGVAILAGVALAFNLPWILALLVPALAGCYVVLVLPEERYLAATFGEEYRSYAATVHRWIGRARRSRPE